MHGRYGDLDYPRPTKLSFLLGLGMFVVGEIGEFGLKAAGMAIPAWEYSLLMTMAGIGVVLALFSPFVFGIIFPLTE